MFILEEYFQKIIDKNLLDGSWLFLGLNEGEKLESVLKISRANSTLRDVLIISDPARLQPEILDNFPILNPSIDSIRQAIRFLYLTGDNKKFLIINRAEDLEIEAQNALLKVTEEPPKNAVLFFLVRNENCILPTLCSRLKKFDVHLAKSKDYFRGIISEAALKFCGDPKNNFSLIKNYFLQNDDGEKFLNDLILLWRDQVFNAQGLNDLKISNLPGNMNWRVLPVVFKTLKRLKDYNINPRLQIENLIFQTQTSYE